MPPAPISSGSTKGPNRTLVKQLVQVQHFHQSQYDPC